MLNTIINVDLHIHSKASDYKENIITKPDGTKSSIVEDSTIENLDILLTCLNKKNINLFAFSDHNRFDNQLFKAAKNKISNSDLWPNIKGILPSVEFDVRLEESKPSCHIITIFDVKNDEDSERIETYINSNLIKNKSEAYTLDAFENLMRNIKLNTIFIACQRKSLENGQGRSNSISDSVEDIYEFLKVGFISSLEFQKSNVEGMLLENLKDFPKQIGLVCGSDCHQWEYYPHHDQFSQNKDKKYFFSIKALPNFLGLLFALTSPETRFRRQDVHYPYLDNFNLGENKINLSPGINAIIGENGSGKTTLFTFLHGGNLQSHQRKIVNNNKLSKPSISMKCQVVKQNEIIEKNKGEFIFSDEYFDKIDSSFFESKIKMFANSLYEYITFNIDKEDNYNKISSNKLDLDAELYYSKTYYISINSSSLVLEDNIYKERLVSLNQILHLIKSEYNNEYYDKTEKHKLKESFESIKQVRLEILKKYKKRYLDLEIKNIIISKSKDYNEKIKRLSVTDDTNIFHYRDKVKQFIDMFRNYYKDYVLTKKENPNFIQEEIIGISERKCNGYSFIKKAKYHKEKELVNHLLMKLFNKDFQNFEKLFSIKDYGTLVKAVSGANDENLKEKYDDNIDKYISDYKKETYEIVDGVSKNKMGSTLGEKSLVYYRYITSEQQDYDILLIDQPEDNISNVKINTDLIKYLNYLRDKKQVIFITHNPLLVINLDVDNVIILHNEDSNITITNGCLEQDQILNETATLLDGGKETIEKRLKLYYGK